MSKKEVLQITSYEINILMLSPIPELNNLDSLTLTVFDLYTTQLHLDARKKKVVIKNADGRKERKEAIESPEVTFYLMQDVETSVSLSQVLLPMRNLLAARVERIDSESVKVALSEGQEAYIKLTYKLFVYTQQYLRNTTKTYEEQQRQNQEQKAEFKQNIDKMRANFEEMLEVRVRPYQEQEKKLVEEIQARDKEIRKLSARLPSERQQEIVDFISKL